jgi:hypothetical protein
MSKDGQDSFVCYDRRKEKAGSTEWISVVMWLLYLLCFAIGMKHYVFITTRTSIVLQFHSKKRNTYPASASRLAVLVFRTVDFTKTGNSAITINTHRTKRNPRPSFWEQEEALEHLATLTVNCRQHRNMEPLPSSSDKTSVFRYCSPCYIY